MELTLDKNRPVMLRLSDRDCLQLPHIVNITEALSMLLAAKQTWQVQGCVGEDEQEQLRQVNSFRDGLATVSSASRPFLHHTAGGSSSSISTQYSAPAAGPDVVPSSRRRAGLFGLFGSRNTAAAANGGGSSSSTSRTSSSHNLQSQAGTGPPPAAVLRSMFGSDERLGVPGTLHRISAMRDREQNIVGLTYRIGRHVPGVGLLLADVLAAMKASLMPEVGAAR